MNEEKVCKNCKSFQIKLANKENETGSCTRYPPCHYDIQYTPPYRHPEVLASDSCGEWIAKKENDNLSKLEVATVSLVCLLSVLSSLFVLISLIQGVF